MRSRRRPILPAIVVFGTPSANHATARRALPYSASRGCCDISAIRRNRDIIPQPPRHRDRIAKTWGIFPLERAT